MNGLLVLGVWALVAALIAMVAGWTSFVQWTNTNSGLSSWVQAIGSIVAILATGWSVNRAHALSARKAAADALAEDVRKLSSIASGIFHCRAQIESLKRFSAYAEHLELPLDHVRRQVQALQAIQVLDIPDWTAAVAVSQGVGAFAYLESQLQPVTPIPHSQQIRDNRVAECGRAVEKFLDAERVIRAALIDRGADVPQQQMWFADACVRSLSVSTTSSET